MNIFKLFFGKKQQALPCDLKLAKQMVISGDWTKSVWKELPVRVYPEPDAVATFFSQPTLPYLWPDIEEYKQYVDSQEDAQRSIRLSWIVAYLHHPNAEVLLKTLRDHIPADLLGMFAVNDALADLLVHQNPEVRSEAAKVIWKCSDASLEQIFTILTSQGILPSGIDSQDAKRAVKILQDSCPQSRKQLFGQIAKETLGEKNGILTVSIGDTNVGYRVVAVKDGSMEHLSIVLAERVSDDAPTKYVVWAFDGSGFKSGIYENEKAEAQRVFDSRTN